jgi:hypothetical protein
VTLQTLTVTIAEGATLDARGQIALVGLEPQAWIPSDFPAPIVFAIAIVVQGEPDDESDLILRASGAKVSVTVSDPEGTVLYFSEEEQHRALRPPPPDLNLPPRMQILLVLNLLVERPGLHEVTIAWMSDGVNEAMRWSRQLRIEFAPAPVK